MVAPLRNVPLDGVVWYQVGPFAGGSAYFQIPNSASELPLGGAVWHQAQPLIPKPWERCFQSESTVLVVGLLCRHLY